MATPDAPSLRIQREDPSLPTPPRQSTSITLAMGITERGPVGVPTLITSFAEFEAKFGSWHASAFLPQAIFGAYENAEEEGIQIWVLRTVHYTDITDANSATSAAAALATDIKTVGGGAPTSGTVTGSVSGPFVVSNGDDIDISIDGNPTVTATVNALAATLECVTAETYDFSTGGEQLTVIMNRGSVQTVTFQTSNFAVPAAGTAEEVAAVIAAQLTGASVSVTSGGTKVTITSDLLGTDSYIEVTGGSANALLAFSTSETATTASNVANAAAATAAEMVTIIDAVLDAASPAATADAVGQNIRLTSDQTGASSSIQVLASSTLDTILGFDNATHDGSASGAQDTLAVYAKYDGAYGNQLTIEILTASNEEPGGTQTEYFNLNVLRNGVSVPGETWVNLTMDSTNARYVETIINDANTGSEYIQVTDQSATGTALTRRPLNIADRATPNKDVPYGPMTGGLDGLTNAETGNGDIDDNDFIGSAVGLTGLQAFNNISNRQLLICPDRPTPDVHEAMIQYCEVKAKGELFAVLDCPAGLTKSTQTGGIGGYISDNGLFNRSEFAAMYWPRLKMRNPSKAVFGNDDNVTVPYSGHVVGVYARHDASVPAGVWKPPAGVDNLAGVLRGVTGVENEDVYDEDNVKLFFPLLVNPITTMDGLPFFLDGARTLRENGSFPTIGESRGVIYFTGVVRRGLVFTRQSPNTRDLRNRANEFVTRFLRGEMDNEAFASRNASEAFYVDTSDKLNPPSLVRDRQMRIRVGLATVVPNEFTLVTVTQDTRAIDNAAA